MSVGLVGERLLLDLDYAEDSQAHVDANFVGTGKGELVEVQLTGEGGPFPAARLQPDAGTGPVSGIRELTRIQAEVLSPWLPLPW